MNGNISPIRVFFQREKGCRFMSYKTFQGRYLRAYFLKSFSRNSLVTYLRNSNLHVFSREINYPRIMHTPWTFFLRQ